MPVALITGVLGQDGSLLTELLRGKGYRVAGIELSAPANPPADVELFVGDASERACIEAAVTAVEPDEIYHLAGQTSVGLSFHEPVLTFQSNALSALHVLDVARLARRRPRVLIASSGEIFGDTGGLAASESTPFRPASPYGAAKSAAAHLAMTYRASFGVFVSLAFFYNHESSRRPERFVTRKIVRAACRIKRGLAEQLELGDTSVVRDWGFAPEYVDAAWRMLQQSQAEDFVLATGQSCSLQHFVERAFACVGLNAKAHVVQKSELVRPSEIPAMQADPSRAAERLGWRATVHVDALVERLVAAEMALLESELGGA
jgi:GDPmannose 4,6-dehydratase